MHTVLARALLTIGRACAALVLAGVSCARQPTPVGRLRRRAWLRAAAVALAVLLVLTGLEVGVRVIAPDAVQVTASDPFSGHTLATATV